MTTKRTWVTIAVGAAILLVFVAIGAGVVGVSWMRDHLEMSTSSESDAARAFDAERARFPGQQPLLEMHDGTPRYTVGAGGPPTPATSVSTLHVLAFDAHDGKLARFELPFWLLRLKSTPIRISAYASGFDDGGVKLTPEEIERHGPGIVLDFAPPGGQRVLIWAD